MTNQTPDNESVERQSVIEEEQLDSRDSLVHDPEQVALIEAANGVEQTAAAMDFIQKSIAADSCFELKPSLICQYNYLAIKNLWKSAGVYRSVRISISNTPHEPPLPHEVPALVEEMCDYVNDPKHTPLHAAAYLMWRINWIHPFVEGNGRTTRIISHIVFCARSGFLLPGTKTMPEQIAENRQPYYDCLSAADEAWKNGVLDVSAMEELLKGYLAVQLLSAYDEATGSDLLDELNS